MVPAEEGLASPYDVWNRAQAPWISVALSYVLLIMPVVLLGGQRMAVPGRLGITV